MALKPLLQIRTYVLLLHVNIQHPTHVAYLLHCFYLNIRIYFESD